MIRTLVTSEISFCRDCYLWEKKFCIILQHIYIFFPRYYYNIRKNLVSVNRILYWQLFMHSVNPLVTFKYMLSFSVLHSFRISYNLHIYINCLFHNIVSHVLICVITSSLWKYFEVPLLYLYVTSEFIEFISEWMLFC